MVWAVFTTWLPDIKIECATIEECESIVTKMIRDSGVDVVYPTNAYPCVRVQNMDSGVVYEACRNIVGDIYLGVME